MYEFVLERAGIVHTVSDCFYEFRERVHVPLLTRSEFHPELEPICAKHRDMRAIRPLSAKDPLKQICNSCEKEAYVRIQQFKELVLNVLMGAKIYNKDVTFSDKRDFHGGNYSYVMEAYCFMTVEEIKRMKKYATV